MRTNAHSFGQSYYRNKGTEEKNAPPVVYLGQIFNPLIIIMRHLLKLSFLAVEIHSRLHKEIVKIKETRLSAHKPWRLKSQSERWHFYLFVWLLTYSQWSRTNHYSKTMFWTHFFHDCVNQVRLFSLSEFAWKPFTAITSWRSDPSSTCHSLDNQTVPLEVQMSPGHIFRDCQHSDEAENSWGNTRDQELPKSMSKWREKTLANVKVSLVVFLQIFLSFHSENWGAVFSRETKPGQLCCRACHIDKVRSTRARNRLQQLTALAPWEFTHTNKKQRSWGTNNPLLSVLNHGTANTCDFYWISVSEQFPFGWVISLFFFFLWFINIKWRFDLNSPGCVSRYYHQSWSQAKADSFFLKCQCR